jgi:hypothetical protein
VQFLVQEISLFGFKVQNWMLIVLVLVIAFMLFAWGTRNKA